MERRGKHTRREGDSTQEFHYENLQHLYIYLIFRDYAKPMDPQGVKGMGHRKEGKLG